jgi:hypothetical protein
MICFMRLHKVEIARHIQNDFFPYEIPSKKFGSK